MADMQRMAISSSWRVVPSASSSRRSSPLRSLLLLSLLLLVSLSSVVLAQTVTSPPRPDNGFGRPWPDVWQPSDGWTSAGVRPLNGAANSADCSNGNMRTLYTFNQLENYQQLVTFFPQNCNNLRAVITQLPSPSVGTLYQYSPTTGRSYPIDTIGTTLTRPDSSPSNMLLFQPALNSFSVYDRDLTRVPRLNSSLASFRFHVEDVVAHTQLPGGGAVVEVWVLWQNQHPLCASLNLPQLDTGMAPSYKNQVINLPVTDPDNAGPNPLNQLLTAYIRTLPAHGALYQYDASNTVDYRGAQITAPDTPLSDAAPGMFRVVLAIGDGETGRPYASFTYYADDGQVDSLQYGTISVDVLKHDPVHPVDDSHSVDQNSAVKFILDATCDSGSADTLALTRARITSMPTRGSLFQVLPDGSVGQRVQVVPTDVQDASRAVWFKPDPYSTNDPDPFYTKFKYRVDSGLSVSAEEGEITISVTPVHLAPFAQNLRQVSLTGNDVALRFIGSTMQPSPDPLEAVIKTLPARGTLKQSDGTPITSAPALVTDTSFLTVTYTPEPNALNPTQPLRYTESFSFVIREGGVESEEATATVQVGSEIKPPLVYSSVFYTRQNETLLLQLNGTVQDPGDSWTPFITRAPAQGSLYQMTNAQRGSLIPSSGSTPVADPNFYVYFVPDRFSAPVVTFEFLGQNSEGQQAASTATVTIHVEAVPFAPTVPATQTVTTQASEALVVTCSFFAGPTPPPTVALWISAPPAAGKLYQWNGTTLTRGEEITSANISAAIGLGLPGVRITDPQGLVQYDPPPYEHGPAQLGYAFAQFEYIASDGALRSPAPGVVTLAVTQVNFAPIVHDASLTLLQETSLTIFLSNLVDNPSKIDGNRYVCIIASLPAQGTLYQVDSNGRASTMIPVPNVPVSDEQFRVIYRPKNNVHGVNVDSFRFFAEDPDHFIKSIRLASVTLSITFVNKAPIAPAQSARLHENQGKVIQLAPIDPEGSPVRTFLTAANLPKGALFQFHDFDALGTPGPGMPAGGAYANLVTGGGEADPESGEYNTLANYTGEYGGGFDVSPYIGAPITSFPALVTDARNRVVFAPEAYTHGNAAYDYIYGNPHLGEGTLSYIADDGLDNSTSAGTVSVRVHTVRYAPLAHSVSLDMDEDSFLLITLPITKFDPEESAPCYILSVPATGALFQYDGRNPIAPKAEQILSRETQVQDINPDGSPGSGRTVVYEPPKLAHGRNFANFSFFATNGLQSQPGVVTVNVNKINHRPTTASFHVTLSGHNSTTPVTFQVTDVDFDPVYVNITRFPDKGALWSRASFFNDTSPSGFHRYIPVAGSMLTPGAGAAHYPPLAVTNTSASSTVQSFSLYFDDFNMGARPVPTGCVREGTTVPCGYTNFTFRVLDSKGASSDGFVEVTIQCGPSYVVNTWQSVGAACVKCPIGAICPTEGQFTPLAERGYWRGLTPTGLMFVACDPPAACLGTWNQSAAVTDLDAQCAEGYHGRLCAACRESHYKLNNECKACTSSGVFWLVLAGVPASILLMWFVLHVSRRGVDLTFFSIVLTYCQILSVYASYHLTWPESVMTTLTVFSISHLNLDIFAVSCYYDTGSYSDKWIAKMAVPPGLAAGVLALVGLLVLLRRTIAPLWARWEFGERAKQLAEARRLREEEGMDDGMDGSAGTAAGATGAGAGARPALHRLASSGVANKDRGVKDQLAAAAAAELAALDTRSYINNDPSAGFDASTPFPVWVRYYVSLGVRTFTLLMFVAYLPICVKSFQIFACTSFPDGTYTFDPDPSLTCYSPWWDELKPWAIVAVIVYGAGIPAWFLWGLHRTAPPFEWTAWWAFIYYPRVKRAGATVAAKARAKLGPAAEAKGGNGKNGGGGGKAPPPPPANPPSIPAPPSDESTKPSPKPSPKSLHGDDSKHSPSKGHTNRSARDGWGASANLSLTSAESTNLSESQKISRFMFTLVIDPFRDSLFFWMIIVLLRSFLLAMVSIFFADEPVYQATLALLVLFLYTLATAYFRPYVNPNMNKLEFFTMSCACLVLFCGFLFVGESNKDDPIFHVLTAVCLLLIIVSFAYIGRMLLLKMEEVFHCWNCRRVPLVAAPPAAQINAVAKTLRAEIQAAGMAAAPALRRIAAENRSSVLPHLSRGASVGSTRGSSRELSRKLAAATALASPSGASGSSGSGSMGVSMGVTSPTNVVASMRDARHRSIDAPLLSDAMASDANVASSSAQGSGDSSSGSGSGSGHSSARSSGSGAGATVGAGASDSTHFKIVASSDASSSPQAADLSLQEEPQAHDIASPSNVQH